MRKLLYLLFCLPALLQAKDVKVDNVKDLFNAIAPNTTIYLAPGDYNFSKLPKESATEYAKFQYEEVNIMGVRNLEIIGEGYAELGVEDPYSNVFRFNNCQDITLRNVVMGHFIEKGYCEGSVVAFYSSQDIKVEKCEMYGSGTYGIDANDVDGLTVSNSVIKDCSYGTITMNDVSNVEFTNTQFKRCQAGISIRGSSRLILFSECYISGLKDYQDWGKWNEEAKAVFFLDSGVSSVLVKDCRFLDNQVPNLNMGDGEVTIRNASGSGNDFDL